MANKFFNYFLVAVNLIGFVFGIYFYLPQLLGTDFFLWLIVIDCPLQVFLFAVILFFESRHPLPDIVKFFNLVGLLKYGFWTVFVIFLYSDIFLKIDALGYGLRAFLHVGMAFEAVFLLGMFKPRIKSMVVVAILYLINDFSDYIFGTLPWIPEDYHLLLFMESVLASIFLPLYFYLRYK